MSFTDFIFQPLNRWIENQYNEQRIAEQNQYNSPLSQMARFREAGLSPALMYDKATPGNQSQTNMDASQLLPKVDILGRALNFAQQKLEMQKTQQEINAQQLSNISNYLELQLKGAQANWFPTDTFNLDPVKFNQYYNDMINIRQLPVTKEYNLNLNRNLNQYQKTQDRLLKQLFLFEKQDERKFRERMFDTKFELYKNVELPYRLKQMEAATLLNEAKRRDLMNFMPSQLRQRIYKLMPFKIFGDLSNKLINSGINFYTKGAKSLYGVPRYNPRQGIFDNINF